MRRWIGFVGLLAGATNAAHAEKIHTFWRPVPANVLPSVATSGVQFASLLLLPVKLVELDAEVNVGDVKVPAGTQLYVVVNDSGKIGYCTRKNWSAGNLAKSLGIPILDKRPCFVDEDGEGVFDRSFRVFNKYKSEASGSIDTAIPLPKRVAYHQVDPQSMRDPDTLGLMFRGKGSLANLHIWPMFPGLNEYQTANVECDRKLPPCSLSVGNLTIVATAVQAKTINISIKVDPNLFLLDEFLNGFPIPKTLQ